MLQAYFGVFQNEGALSFKEIPLEFMILRTQVSQERSGRCLICFRRGYKMEDNNFPSLMVTGDESWEVGS